MAVFGLRLLAENLWFGLLVLAGAALSAAPLTIPFAVIVAHLAGMSRSPKTSCSAGDGPRSSCRHRRGGPSAFEATVRRAAGLLAAIGLTAALTLTVNPAVALAFGWI